MKEETGNHLAMLVENVNRSRGASQGRREMPNLPFLDKEGTRIANKASEAFRKALAGSK